MTKQELLDLAAAQDVEGRSAMTKDPLVTALNRGARKAGNRKTKASARADRLAREGRHEVLEQEEPVATALGARSRCRAESRRGQVGSRHGRDDGRPHGRERRGLGGAALQGRPMRLRSLVVFGAGYVLGTRAVGNDTRRSPRPQARPRNDWAESTLPLAQPSPPSGWTTTCRVRPRMAHTDRRSLAGGAVVETRLCARLFGIKLLVVDGTVTLVPGTPVEPGDLVVLPVSWAEVEPPPLPALAPRTMLPAR